jgi:hypothetical protein
LFDMPRPPTRAPSAVRFKNMRVLFRVAWRRSPGGRKLSGARAGQRGMSNIFEFLGYATAGFKPKVRKMFDMPHWHTLASLSLLPLNIPHHSPPLTTTHHHSATFVALVYTAASALKKVGNEMNCAARSKQRDRESSAKQSRNASRNIQAHIGQRPQRAAR